MKKTIDIIYHIGVIIFLIGLLAKIIFHWPYYEYLYYIFGITLIIRWIYNICLWNEYKKEKTYIIDIVCITIISIFVLIYLFIKLGYL